jgi:hypothetical protein
MYPDLKLIDNERGSVIVVALLLLVFLTIIGITATTNTRTELNITRNNQIYKRDFYAADSGWREAAINLQNFGMAYPVYSGGVKAFGNPDGSLNQIDYAYEITRLPIEEISPGNSGACKNVIFQVKSRAMKDGERTQEIEARLVKLCCGGY